jgi:type II secretory pathway pseudopilin PulG
MTPLRARLRRRRSQQHGWTLIELIVTLGVFAAAMGSLVEVLRGSTALTSVLTKQGDVQERARRVVDSLKREMRWADTSTMVVTTLNGSTRLSFRTPIGYDAGAVVWSPAITYQINPSNVDSNHDGVLNEGCLVRIQSGRTTVLCNDVPLGGFVADLTGSTLQFSLRVAATGLDRRVAATTASAAVTLRNKSS